MHYMHTAPQDTETIGASDLSLSLWPIDLTCWQVQELNAGETCILIWSAAILKVLSSSAVRRRPGFVSKCLHCCLVKFL